MQYIYKTVPFMGQGNTFRGGANASNVAEQLTSNLNNNATNGWEFYQFNSISIEVPPGCLGAIFGRSTEFIKFDMLVFRKLVDSKASDLVEIESNISTNNSKDSVELSTAEISIQAKDILYKIKQNSEVLLDEYKFIGKELFGVHVAFEKGFLSSEYTLTDATGIQLTFDEQTLRAYILNKVNIK